MKLLKELEGLVSDKLNVVKAIVDLFKLETRLASMTIVPLLLNIGLLFCVSLTLWLSANGLLVCLANLVWGNIIFSMIFIMLFNLGIFFGLLQLIRLHLKKMSFEKTRQYFTTKESQDGNNTESIDCANRIDGEKTSV